MKVLMVEPGKSPYAAEIESGLKSLQAAVGGDIQAVYPYEPGHIFSYLSPVFFFSGCEVYSLQLNQFFFNGRFL